MSSTTTSSPGSKPPSHNEDDGNGRDNNGREDHGQEGHGHGNRPAPADEHDLPKDLPRPSGLVVVLVAVAAVLLLAGVFIIGYIPHRHDQTQIETDAQATASDVPIVQAAYPKEAKPENDIFLPANVFAWQQTALYPRALGYLAKNNHDIGDRVMQGDVLATISAPDIDAQLLETEANLEQGRAAVEKAKADVTIAKNTYLRYQQWMNTTAGVSQQDLEDKQSQYQDAVAVEHQSEATVDALAASVKQLKVSQSFEKIIAPFTGVVTARNYDAGALMNPSNASSKEMFDLAETDWLRVYINVPQTYASVITTGKTQAFLTVRNFPGHEFPGWVTRASGAVDPTNRTMTVEVDIPNADGRINPGMYGTVRLPLSTPHPSLIVPTSALVFDADGLRLAIVKNDKTVHFTDISAGRDFGTTIEITKGLESTDQVIDNPGEQLAEGSTVQLAKPKQSAQPASNQKVAQAN